MAARNRGSRLPAERSLAVDVAREAGEMLLHRARGRRDVEFKGEIDLVTDADYASEKIIVDAIREACPDDLIIAEEGRGADAPGGSRRTWLIDPLDGTTNYAHRFPIWAVSIALMVEGQLEVGVVYVPPLDEMYVAVRGEGAFLNDEPITVSSTQDLGHAMLASGFAYNPERRVENLPLWGAFVRRSRAVRRAGAAAYDLCCVAAGRYDGYWERETSAWDVAAGALLVSEAEGLVSNYQGGSFDPFAREVVATTPGIHAEVIATIQQALGGEA